MELLIDRKFKKPNYTIGKMYIDGKYFCDVLEDTDRGLTDSMSVEEINRLKIYGKTAIPTGKYKVIFSMSSKFKKILPEVLNVKGYAGIRIHSGNTDKDTFGCPLLGINNKVGMVTNSRVTYNKFESIVKPHANSLTLTIK